MGEETGEGEEQDEEYEARKEDTHTHGRAHTPLLYPTKIKSDALLEFCTG